MTAKHVLDFDRLPVFPVTLAEYMESGVQYAPVGTAPFTRPDVAEKIISRTKPGAKIIPHCCEYTSNADIGYFIGEIFPLTCD
jgi:hypothetical protein